MDIENDESFSNIITTSQIFQIKQQILAYKYLVKGLPIPKEIEKNLTQINKEQWEQEREKVFQRTVKFYKEKIEKNSDFMDLLTGKLQKKIDDKFSNFLEVYNSKDNLNNLTQKNIETRINQIESLLKLNILEEKTKITLETELKFLKSNEIYMDLKETILSKINKEEDLPFKLYEKTFFSLDKYRRERPQKKTEVSLPIRV